MGRLRARVAGIRAAGVIVLLAVSLALSLFGGASARGETLRLAYFDTELGRDGPGLLLRDIARGGDAQVAAVQAVIAAAGADILVLAGIDYDAEALALAALNAGLSAPYPHLFARRPNTGMPSGLDLDGNGRLGEARDAIGYGAFNGAGGLAILSRFPFEDGVRDFSDMLWRDLPDSLMRPEDAGGAVQRLSSVGHWLVPVDLGGKALWLGVFRATTPVFDGPQDRNGRRNHDEIAFWSQLIAGGFGGLADAPFVLLGGANLDPARGEGRREAIADLLDNRALTDPFALHRGGQHATVDWPEVAGRPGPGEMRVDYVLPSVGLQVRGSGVLWPEKGTELADIVVQASRHRLVWVDLDGPH